MSKSSEGGGGENRELNVRLLEEGIIRIMDIFMHTSLTHAYPPRGSYTKSHYIHLNRN